MMGRTQVPYAYICPTCRHQLNRHLLPQENPIEGPYVCPCGCEHMRAEQAVSINRTQFESGNYHDELPAAAAGEPSPPNPVPVSEFDEPHKWTGTP